MDEKLRFGAKIKNLRKKAGFTQEKFAEFTDLTPRQIVRIEMGQSFPSFDSLVKIANTLNIDISDLFSNKHFESVASIKKNIIAMLDNADLRTLRTIFLILKDL